MWVNNATYTYRIMTKSVFERQMLRYFDIFILGDPGLNEHFIFENVWRETLLFKTFDSPYVPKLMQVGQLQDKIIFREIEEQEGITFADYFESRMLFWKAE